MPFQTAKVLFAWAGGAMSNTPPANTTFVLDEIKLIFLCRISTIGVCLGVGTVQGQVVHGRATRGSRSM